VELELEGGRARAVRRLQWPEPDGAYVP
jgi:hypothetical protein